MLILRKKQILLQSEKFETTKLIKISSSCFQDGRMSCVREKRTNCPRLTCPRDEQFSVQGQCCDFCRGTCNFITARKRSLRRLCFYSCLSVHRGGMHGGSQGGHVWLLPGGHVWLLPGGHAWLLLGGHVWLLQGACVVALGGMHGCSGGCVVAPRGHAWLLLGGGHVWLLWGACMVAPGGMHGCSGACMVAPGGMVASGGHAWDTTRYGDTVNEWVVRILLECILVLQ